MVDLEPLVDFVNASEPRDARTVEVREALRALMLANNEVEVDVAAATAALERAARRARLEPTFGADARLVPRATGAAAELGELLARVHAAMAEGSWPRAKACRAHDCDWAFVDYARNRSRAWCSMKTCGNREKVRSYRERHQSP